MTGLFFSALCALLCAACASLPECRTGASPGIPDVRTEGRAEPSVGDPALGPEVRRVFSGRSGAAPCRLVVRHRCHSGDGVFRFERSARVGARTQSWSGRRYTLRGTAGDPDAVVWQCRAAEGPVFDFLLCDGGRCLRLAEVHGEGDWAATVGVVLFDEGQQP